MRRGYIGARVPTAGDSVPRTASVLPTPDTRYTIEDALDIFVKAKEAEGVRPRTIGNYREHITYLMRYTDRTPFYVDELTSDLIRSYIL